MNGHPTQNNRAVVPHPSSEYSGNRRQHNARYLDPYSSMQRYEESFDTSLFPPSGVAPSHDSFNFLDQQHQQLASMFGDFGIGRNFGFGGSSRRGFGFGNSLDSMMNGMMSMQSAGLSNGGDGVYHSSVMMMSSTTGADGRQHVEKYAKSSSGNTLHKVSETKEAYSNSAAGIDKLAWERQLENKGRRVVQERNRNTGEVISNDEIAGMERDEECERFNTDWNQVASHHLPIRARMHPSMVGQEYNGFGQIQQEPRQVRSIHAEPVDEEPQPSRRSHRTTRSRQ